MVRDKIAIFNANEQLRYAIRVLHGLEFRTFEENRISWVRGIIHDLERSGWFWQARILRSHLNEFLRGREPSTSSFEDEGILSRGVVNE